MKIAVTGSSGMLGQEIVKRLKKQRYDVLEITSQNCNILDRAKLFEILQGVRVVIHAAGIIDEQDPALEEVNVRGTENVLEAAAQNSVQQFIFISTAGVYSKDSGGVKTESTFVIPETRYEKTKADAENIVYTYQEVFHITILRLAIIVGDNKFWRSIIRTIAKGLPLIGSGKNSWQAVTAEDAADAAVFCVANSDTYGETFNVAEKDAMTLEQTANAIRELLGMRGKIGKIPFAVGMAIACANSVLNFNEVLKPPYVLRMQRERLYSAEKIGSIGWKAKHTTREKLEELVKEFVKTKKRKQK